MNKDYLTTLTTALPASRKEKFVETARSIGLSPSAFLRRIINDALDAYANAGETAEPPAEPVAPMPLQG